MPLKHKLLELCVKYTDQRIATAQLAIQAAQASANEETKSSSGDKYETGRAMAQLEIEKNSTQLSAAREMASVLARIDPDKSVATVQAGSLVITNRGNYFIAIPAGELKVEGITYFAISPSSPLGACMSSLAAGQSFSFNGRQFTVESVL